MHGFGAHKGDKAGYVERINSQPVAMWISSSIRKKKKLKLTTV